MRCALFGPTGRVIAIAIAFGCGCGKKSERNACVEDDEPWEPVATYAQDGADTRARVVLVLRDAGIQSASAGNARGGTVNVKRCRAAEARRILLGAQREGVPIEVYPPAPSSADATSPP